METQRNDVSQKDWKTSAVPASENPHWRHVWNLECDLMSAQELCLELWKIPPTPLPDKGGKKKGRNKPCLCCFSNRSNVNRPQECTADSKTEKVGEVHVPWRTLLASPTLARDKSFPVMHPGRSNRVRCGQLALRLSLSVTPLWQAPFVLETKPSVQATDDNGFWLSHADPDLPQPGRWIARNVVDHTESLVYVVRIKDMHPTKVPTGVKPSERVIYVHPVPPGCSKAYGTSLPFARTVAVSAHHQELLSHAPNLTECHWSLLDGQALLRMTITETTPTADTEETVTLSFQITGPIGSSVILRQGRHLQYTVKGASAYAEEAYVTVIRCTGTHPNGAATAVFNWKVGTMEVGGPDESVVFLLLLSAAIGTSLFDLPSKKFKFPSSDQPNIKAEPVMLNPGVRDPRDNYTNCHEPHYYK